MSCRYAIGHWKTAHERLWLWTSDGTWDKILSRGDRQGRRGGRGGVGDQGRLLGSAGSPARRR
ncbi:MAG TPA: hypothetical protein VGP82_13915, partial [Ktedonobacterales bacterium]|nr:hypothetical protein [Ktedonobacterales bacterium]